ncbi:MAG: hypothetical protein ACRDHZ_24220 [Ktedonobacteraceae bacterium]
MQGSTSLSPQDVKRIALRQGLLCGIVVGCFALLITLLRQFSYEIPLLGQAANGLWSNNFSLPACLAFFVAGWRAAKKTGRLDIGVLAGFWAGITVAIFAVVILFITAYGSDIAEITSLSSLIYYIVNVFVTALSALLVGPIFGVLGGFIGRIYAVSPTLPTVPSSPSPTPQPSQSPPSPV